MNELYLDEEGPRAGTVVGTYLYVWLMVGFFTGTAVLLGPAGWLAGWLQRAGWSDEAQNRALTALILCWFVASMLLARALVRGIFHSGGRPRRLGIPLVVTALAVLSLAGWMNPARMMARVAGGTGGEVSVAGGPRFRFGPYPDRAKLAELRREGVSAVVSLQHPAVPIEVPGIAAERRAAAELGIRFVHAPMLPWISGNERALAVIRELVRSGRGTYYVHCGLGRDRTAVVRRLIETMGGRPVSAAAPAALTFAGRKAQAAAGVVPSADFERGGLTELEPGIWLVPHPNQRELFGYLLAGQVRHVVSVLDPRDPQQGAWLREERDAFTRYRVPATFRPLDAGDAAAARSLAEQVRRLPRPVAIIAPRTPWTDHSQASDGTAAAAAIQRAFAAPAGATVPPAPARGARTGR